MTELEALSKLKLAGKLHFWRGTIEIPEIELHVICDEIQAEYDHAISALNKAAGNWARADAQMREHEGSRYHQLFGTPERAARTMVGKCCDCLECVIVDACEYGEGEGCLLNNYDALLEWLRGDEE